MVEQNIDLSKYITYGDLSANDFVNETRDKAYADSIADV